MVILARGLLLLFGVCGVVFLVPSREQADTGPAPVVEDRGEPERYDPVTVGPAVDRDPRWAKRLEGRGLANFHKVSDDLYRAEHPEAQGFATLRDIGIRTVMNLRQFHSTRDEAAAAGLNYRSLSVNTFNLEDKEIHAFLEVVTDPDLTPVFVHCKHGADRTGTMCAVYRIVVQGWSREDAIEEMRHGGYNFHEIFKNLVRELEKLDVEELRRLYAPKR